MTQAHGSIQTDGSTPRIVVRRTVEAAPERLWAAFTDAEALATWIGVLRTDEATGDHTFSMVEGDQASEPKPVQVTRCREPRELEFSTARHGGWDMGLLITPAGTGCELEFHQVLRPEDDPTMMGPGWEYYMQRAIAFAQGTDPNGVAWDDYYPALAEAYAPAPGKP